MPFSRKLGDGVSWLLQYELASLEEYVEEVERFLAKQKRNFEEWYEGETRGMLPEDADHFGDFHSEGFQQIANEFPKTLRHSLLVAIHSRLEHFLRERCEARFKSQNLPIKLSDLRDRGAMKTPRDYLKKIAGIDFPDCHEWNKILYFSRLRNAIVHTNGVVGETSDRDKNLRATISGDANVGLDSIGEIELREKFIPDALETLFDFLAKLDEAFKEKTGEIAVEDAL